MIGYEKDGITYCVATHLGGAYLSFTEANVYFSEADLQKDLKKAKGFLLTSKKHMGGFPSTKYPRGIKAAEKYLNGRLFITRLASPKNEYVPVPFVASIKPNNGSTALRVSMRPK